MASNVAKFLPKQYLDSLGKEDNSHSLDPILVKFKDIGENLKAISPALTNPKYILWLSDLNDAFTDWQNLKEWNKSMKRIFSCHDYVVRMRERSAIKARLTDIEKSLQEASLSKTELRQPSLLLWDRYTFYKSDQITCVGDNVSVEHEKRMVDWLLTSGDDFKAVGIYGVGGSGKTALVKNVLKQKTVADEFKCIIWACLSQLTCEGEMDVRIIIKYLLYRLGLDTDILGGNVDENKDWLMEELERRLVKSRNYILVLDDMWHWSTSFVDDFLGKLKENGGGAVIVTSRRKTVAEKIGEKNMLIHLNPFRTGQGPLMSHISTF